MASTEPDTHPDLHTVTLTHDFYLGVTEFTYGHMATLGGIERDDDAPLPVLRSIAISLLNDMSDAEGYARCYERSAETGDYRAIGDIYTCEGYRLPPRPSGNTPRAVANPPSGRQRRPGSVAFHPGVVEWTEGVQDVAQLTPNHCGLYDMSGNMQERIHDGYAPEAYASHASTNPVGPEVGDAEAERRDSWGQFELRL